MSDFPRIAPVVSSMGMRVFTRAPMGLLLLTTACSTDTLSLHDGGAIQAPPDAGGSQAMIDAGAGDGSLPASACGAPWDAGVRGPSPSCGTCLRGTICFRDACIDRCGSELGFGDQDLAPGLRPLANICADLADGPLAAHGDQLFHVHAERTGLTVALTLDVRRLDTEGGRIGDACSCSAVFTAEKDEDRVELQSRLGLSPSGLYPHFGLTVRDPAPRPGRAYLVDHRNCAIQEQEATAYGGATLLSDDPRDWVVMRADEVIGPGLFMGQVRVANAGASYGIARFDETQVLAALGSGHGSVGLGMFSSDALRRGPYPVLGVDSDFAPWPATFEVLSGRGLAGRPTTSTSGFQLFPVQIADPPHLPFTQPTDLTSGRFSAVVPVGGTSRLLLRHAQGLLVVE